MSGTFKVVSELCSAFDRVTRLERPAVPGQLVEVLPRPIQADEDWQLVRLYDDNATDFQEVFVRERYLKPIEENIDQQDFALQCLLAARSFSANHEALIILADFLTRIQNISPRPSTAGGPFIIFEKRWSMLLPALSDFEVSYADRSNPYMQPFAAAAVCAMAAGKIERDLNRPPNVTELAFSMLFGLEGLEAVVALSREQAADPSIYSIIDHYCKAELASEVRVDIYVSELFKDFPGVLGDKAASNTVSVALSSLEKEINSSIARVQPLIGFIASFIDPIPPITIVPGVPSNVASIFAGNPVGFAELTDPAYWPLITDEPRALVVSYRDTSGKIVGKAGRQFFADRRNGARHHVGVDLFCKENDAVIACADGKIVNFYSFYKRPSTGEDTFALFVQHKGVVVNYGEVKAQSLKEAGLSVGSKVKAGQFLGRVSGTAMIHFETYAEGTKQNSRWLSGQAKPPNLLNPTKLLLNIAAGGKRKLSDDSVTDNTGSARIESSSGRRLDEGDLLTLARTIYGEARGEPARGQEAVAHVVMNRVAKNLDRWGGNDISAVCRRDRQFSCWNSSDPNRSVISAILPGSSQKFDQCLEIAEKVIRGLLPDNTGGATHYYAKYIAAPRWTHPPAKKTSEIGVHRFYTNVT